MEPDRRYPLNLPTFLPATPADHQRNLVELERWANTLPLNPRVSEALYGDTTGVRPPWNLPWGTVAAVQVTTTTDILSTVISDVIGGVTALSHTFTALANRRYRASWFASTPINASAADIEYYLRLTDGANNQLQETRFFMPAAGKNMPSIVGWYTNLTSISGSTTWKLRGVTQSGTTQIYATATHPFQFLIEDIGPLVATPPTA